MDLNNQKIKTHPPSLNPINGTELWFPTRLFTGNGNLVFIPQKSIEPEHRTRDLRIHRQSLDKGLKYKIFIEAKA